jgi:hypothetical protein
LSNASWNRKAIPDAKQKNMLELAQSMNRSTSPIGKIGGAGRDRTDDLMLAKHALSQLSYSP